MVIFSLCGCKSSLEKQKENPYIIVLGIAQDAGYPQANCNKHCCSEGSNIGSSVDSLLSTTCMPLSSTPLAAKPYDARFLLFLCEARETRAQAGQSEGFSAALTF